MQFGLFSSDKNDEHNGVGSVEISEIFMRWGDFFRWVQYHLTNYKILNQSPGSFTVLSGLIPVHIYSLTHLPQCNDKDMAYFLLARILKRCHSTLFSQW